MIRKLLAGLLISFSVSAQDAIEHPQSITWNTYVDVYYSYDFGNPNSHEKPAFLYSYNRHNEVNLNIGLVRAGYANDKIRANLGLMVGTYPQYNLAGEQPLLRNVYEANVGVKLSKKSTLWLDAGIMSSHIGFESAIGKDCWTLTRSIMADNTPYYESGARLSYASKNSKWYVAALVLNGWQRIQKLPLNQMPSFGTQLLYKPNEKFTFNLSTYFGNEGNDTLKMIRYFTDVYAIYQVHPTFGITIGSDVGAQDNELDTSGYRLLYSPIMILRYSPASKWNIAARIEYYNDRNGIIISTNTLNGFETIGYSLNVDYQVNDNVLVRLEGRELRSKDPIFLLNSNPTEINRSVSAALTFWL